MSLAKKFGTNKDLVENGVLFIYPELNFRVRLARASSSNVALLKAREDAGTFDIATDNKLSDLVKGLQIANSEKKVYAKAIVKSWETFRDGVWQSGIEDPEDYDGDKPLLPFTEENVLKVFDAFEVETFFVPYFRVKAEEIENYQGNRQDIVVGNSSAS